MAVIVRHFGYPNQFYIIKMLNKANIPDSPEYYKLDRLND